MSLIVSSFLQVITSCRKGEVSCCSCRCCRTAVRKSFVVIVLCRIQQFKGLSVAMVLLVPTVRKPINKGSVRITNLCSLYILGAVRRYWTSLILMLQIAFAPLVSMTGRPPTPFSLISWKAFRTGWSSFTCKGGYSYRSNIIHKHKSCACFQAGFFNTAWI